MIRRHPQVLLSFYKGRTYMSRLYFEKEVVRYLHLWNEFMKSKRDGLIQTPNEFSEYLRETDVG